MPSRVLETVLTGRNLLSPVLTGAAADVEAFDAKVTAANGRATASADAGAKAQETASAKVAASNVRTAESSSASSAKVVAANARMAESSRAFADVSESSSARAAVSLSSLATKGPVVAAAVVAAMGVVTGKMAGDYQSALTRLSTTAGESQKNLDMVGQGMLDMAGQVGVSAQELAKGMYVVDSAGIHGADSLMVLKAAAQGARQENADLSHVVDAVTTSLHDFHLPASDAAKVTSELIAAVSHGKTTFDELTGSMHSIEPVAVGAGLNIAQTAGALAAMTASGMHADQAAQNLAHTIGSFQNASKPMRDELSQLGLDATDLQQHMGERGIAGTLQLVADRIRNQVDPSGHLLLNALQTNKVAVNDLSIMIGKMPPQLADLASGLLAGTTSQKDFRKAALDMGAAAGAMADQFLASYKGADGFSAALKSGGPMVQTYISALAKATGTADGLRTALQLTGENAASTNAGIAAVGSAAASTKGDIQGWDEVQHNLNQKLAQAGAEAKSLAIEAGQHLLPVLTGIVGWVGSTGLPAIGSLGHGIGDLVHWFTQLPAPVRLVAEAFAALKAAQVLGIFSALGTQVVYARVLLSEFADTVRVTMGQVSAAYGEAAAAARLSASIQNESMASTRIAGAMAGTTAAAKTLAVQGFGAVRSAGAGLISMLGGPWVVGVAAAVGVTYEFVQALHASEDRVKANAASLTESYKAMALGGETARKGAEEIAKQNKAIEDAQKAYDAAKGAATSYGEANYGSALGSAFAGQSLDELKAALERAKKSAADYEKNLSPIERATIAVTAAQNDFTAVMKSDPNNSEAVAKAAGVLRGARADLTRVTQGLTDAEKSHLQLMQDAADKNATQTNSVLAGLAAQDSLNSALQQYNADAADGQHSAEQLNSEQIGLAQSASAAAKAAGEAAAATAAQKGVTDTSIISQQAQLQVLQSVADTLTGPAHDAIMGQIAALQASTGAAAIATGAMETFTGAIKLIPGSKDVIINAPTAEQEARLQALGYTVTHLPDGTVRVSANTEAATTALDNLVNRRWQTTVTVTEVYNGQHISGMGGPGGTQLVNATGNIVHAYAGGGIEPMSAGLASIVKPNTWRVIGDRVRDDEFYIPDNTDPRSLAIGAEYVRRHPEVAASAWAASYNGSGTGFTAAAMPGYGGPGGGTVVHHHHYDQGKRTEISVDATGFNADQIAAKVAARQHEHEFLTGG